MKYIYLLLISTALIVSGCHNHEGHHNHDEHDHDAHEHHHHDEEDDDDDHHEHEAHENPNEIEFSEAKQALFNIQTTKVELAPFASIINCSGEILPSSANEATVVAPVSGRVVVSGKTLVSGAQFSKGQEIVTITSDGVGEDLAKKAEAELEVTKNEYLRDSLLLSDNIISKNHFEQSKLNYQNAKLAYEDLQRRGLKNGGAKVSSPMQGYLKNMLVSQGEYVEVGQPIAVVSQNLRLVLRVDVSTRFAGNLGSIVSANFRASGNDVNELSKMQGRLLSVGKSAENNFVPVYFEFQNDGTVLPGSFVDVFLKLQTSQNCISVPSKSIIEQQGTHTVYVRLDEDCFEPRDVRIGLTDGISTQILSGLNPDDEVVTNGAMKIRLATLSAVPSGHNHQH
ncbi:MAG: efflux RND transporter periplasmic adaptor subunit [Bacteroidales bacterium]|nr:efflux RND transporter periplasmic adaptor subunit [Bacteroidales bacterium]